MGGQVDCSIICTRAVLLMILIFYPVFFARMDIVSEKHAVQKCINTTSAFHVLSRTTTCGKRGCTCSGVEMTNAAWPDRRACSHAISQQRRFHNIAPSLTPYKNTTIASDINSQHQPDLKLLQHQPIHITHTRAKHIISPPRCQQKSPPHCTSQHS